MTGVDEGVPVRLTMVGRASHTLGAFESERFFPEQLLMRQMELAGDVETRIGAPGKFLLSAESDTIRGPTMGPFTERKIIIDLEPGVNVRGQVLDYEGRLPAEVVIEYDSPAGIWETLISLPVRADGSVGPATIPRRRDGVYRVQLEGQLLVPQVQRFDTEEVGATLDLYFDARTGTKLTFRVLNEAEELIEGAKVWMTWPGEDEAFPRESQVGFLITDSEGLVHFMAPDQGDAVLAAVAEGYAQSQWGPADIQILADDVIDLVLSPAGSIRGKVVFDGKPVPNFTIAYFQGSGYMQYSPINFTDREDGSFELEGVETGEIEILAHAPELAQSDPVVVNVVPGEVTEVELELTVGGRGYGQVLDAETRQPIPGLEVHRAIEARSGGIGMEFDNFVEPGPDGRFEVNGLFKTRATVALRRDGYMPTDANASRKADGTFDFGLTLMSRSAALVGQVRVPNGVDPTRVSLEITGATYYGPARLDAQGGFVAPVASAGFASINFTLPNGDMMNATRFLSGGGPWHEEFDLGTSARIHLFVEGIEKLPEGYGLEDLWVTLTRVVPDSTFVSESYEVELKKPLSEGQLTPYLAPGWYGVTAQVPPRLPVASLEIEVLPNQITEVHLGIAGEMRAIRVVDEQRLPIENVSVYVSGGLSLGQLTSTRTDADGVAWLGLLADGPTPIHLGGYSESQLDVVLQDIGTPDNPTEVVYAPATNVTLHVNDRGTSLEGISLMVESMLTYRIIDWSTVGAGGNVPINAISPGPVRIYTLAPGLWQELRFAEVSDSQPIIDVQFRRLGAFEIKVTDAFGKPIANAPVALTSDEYGVDVATWLAEGKVQSSSGMATDATGTLRIDGLPNGPFTWSVEGEFGTISVPPNGVGLVYAQVVK